MECLNNHEVKYILVGGYSVILYGYNRTTGDLDIWVRKDENNYKKLAKAFAQFKMPLFDMTLENFMHSSMFDVFTYGKTPVAIDILTEVKGLTFDECWDKANQFTFDDIQMNVIHLHQLLEAKKAAGRYKDLDDIDHLEKMND
jgi:predicted nucleotidyltransferase